MIGKYAVAIPLQPLDMFDSTEKLASLSPAFIWPALLFLLAIAFYPFLG